MVIFIAGGNVALPECVRRFRQDGMPGIAAYMPRLTTAVVSLTVLYCGGMAILAVPLLRFAYGEQFIGAAVITQLVAAQYVIAAFGSGFGVALKAAGQMKQLWALRATIAVVSITGMIVFVNLFGPIGAGLAGIATATTNIVGVTVTYRRLRKQMLAASDSEPPPREQAHALPGWQHAGVRPAHHLPKDDRAGPAVDGR
ncbi:MAG: hypothetical protein M3186_01810 [Actinomycetota bacterium]|nr:hypothetical protein [Actinomycetota bacterium]